LRWVVVGGQSSVGRKRRGSGRRGRNSSKREEEQFS
jgi:hypothetical protein